MELHEKFEELLRHISFTQAFVDEIVELVSGKVKEILKSNENRLKVLRQQLQGVEVMIANVEEKLFSDVINDDTYKRNMQKFRGEQGKLNDEIESLNSMADNIQQDLLVLPYMLNLHQVYVDAPLGQKHAMIREVFKDNLTYKNGMFRTPSINPDLKCNLLLLKQIGLLDIEQPYEFENRFSYCGEWGIRTRGPVTVNSFQDCRNRPLCQLSGAKVQIPSDFTNYDINFLT